MDYSTLSLEEIRALVTSVSHVGGSDDSYLYISYMLIDCRVTSPDQLRTTTFSDDESAFRLWTDNSGFYSDSVESPARRLNELKVMKL